MYSKVIYVVKSDLHYYPPCVSQIRLLKALGVNVEVWYGTSNKSALDILDKEKIPYISLSGTEKGKNKLSKILNWLNFRKIYYSKVKEISKSDLERTIFWFGTTETSIPLIGKIAKVNYILTSLELLDDKKNKIKRKLFGSLAKNALAIISCEQTRSYIMKYWYNLPDLPYTIPNKPYSLGVERYCNPTNQITEKAINLIKGKKFIIYQGIFQNIEYMCEIAKALKNLNSEYYLVMMGFDTHNHDIINTIRNIYDKTIHIESIPAPLHLEITSHATIGLVFYEDDTLNKAFCAPNKIYEYAGFGIPAIANNIPGLINTIGKSGAAICTSFLEENLKNAIKEIDDNYEEFSESALKFYNDTDNSETMKKLIENLDIQYKYE